LEIVGAGLDCVGEPILLRVTGATDEISVQKPLVSSRNPDLPSDVPVLVGAST
jgi:hypothetical protein